MQTSSPKVDPREFQSLNARFYRANPAEYLELRLWGLVTTVGDSTGPLEVQYDDLKLGRDAPPTDEQRKRYAALESTVLLHHSAEAMLRLYLAHAHRNPCPWLELAKLRNFAEFKTRIAQLRDALDDDDTLSDALEVFTWSPVHDPFKGMPAEAWESHKTGLRQLLQFCIDALLGEAPLYNAAKHGLAVHAGRLGMSLGAPDEDPIINVDGYALSTLEQQEEADGVRRWRMTSRWVHPEQSIALVAVIVRAIESLWEAARGHYRQPDPDPKKIWIAEADKIQQLLSFHQHDGFNVSSMSETLHHDEPPAS